ncbi:MAG: MATE family efflux transporter [Rhodospirillaceae bacterium]|nr:MATE family efflux transporter [Rhodospirillaceae bacterium]
MDTASASPHRRLWALALPILLTNLTTPIVGLTDTAVMGHLDGPVHLGAVSVGAMIFTFVAWSFGFLRMGTTALTAQALGSDDASEERAVLARGLAVAGAIGAVLLVLIVPITAAALALVDPSPEVAGEAETYLLIRGWAFPITLANYALLGWLFGEMRPRAALVQQVSIYTTNVVLDLLFVLQLDMTADGVALASALAEGVGLAVGAALAARHLRRRGGRWERARLLDLAAARRLLGLNRDLFVRTVVLQLAFAWFTAVGARFGDTVLAANAVLLQFLVFSAHALDAFAFAAEALVGTSVGARNPAGVAAAGRVAALWSGIAAAGFAIVYFVAGQPVIAGLTDLEEVRAAAGTYLAWAAPLPIVAVWSYLLDGMFIGATWTGALLKAMVLSFAAFAVAVLTLTPSLENHGLWLALHVFFVARAVTLAAFLPGRLVALGASGGETVAVR